MRYCSVEERSASRRRRTVRATTAAILALAAACSVHGAVVALRCEYLTDPEGIDVRAPRLSWQVTSDLRGDRQTAYQIIAASSAAALSRDHGDLWDTGRVESAQSQHVPYAGAPLGSHARVFWKVRVWNVDGAASPWSKPARWSVGLLAPGDWAAQWIGLDRHVVRAALSDTTWIWFPEGEPATAAPVGLRAFRRVIDLPADRAVKEAHLLATGDNVCSLFVNGRDVGKREDFKVVKDYDITARLAPGRNVLALLGDNRGAAPNPAGVVGRLVVTFERGEPLVIRTDDSWRASAAPPADWKEVDFDDAAWPAARVLGPVGMAPWGEVRAPESRRLAAQWLRKEFETRAGVRRATVHFSGLGVSELYLNGAKVGDAVLSPAASEYPKRIYYVSYDVTGRLRVGANAIGVVLGNGRYYSMRSETFAKMPHYGFPKLLLHLRLEYDDGRVETVVSDDSWRMTDAGPILANNEYDGEEYDARRELAGWSEPGFDASAWSAVELPPADRAELSAQMIDPIRVTETLRPRSITQPQPGVYVFDMGQNMVGWCRLRVRGPAGTTVSLRHAETLTPDGMLYLANLRGAEVTDLYTLRGGDREEVWEPRFTYHGFRFVEVRGFPGEPTLEAIEGRVVHDDVRPAGEFACSSEMLNRIFENVRWGVRGNYRSLPTDCPQRDERQGWLGDRGEECRGEAYMFDVAALYAKWIRDMEDSQQATGSMPDVCPTHWPVFSDNVTWPSTTILAPAMLRRHYADEALAERHYDSAKRWMDYMSQFVRDGVIDRDTYGDWCVPPEDPALIHSLDPARQTAKPLLATAYWYNNLRLMASFAEHGGRTDDAKRWREQADGVRQAFNARFYDAAAGRYDNGSQTSSVLPLAFGLADGEREAPVFQNLVRRITEETNNHIGTGLIGAQFLNRVLTRHGRADLALAIAQQRDYPSWGYMIEHDATTIWELWNGDTADPAMNSHNHVMLVGDLVVWMFEHLAGISPDDAEPGFRRIVMRPEPVSGLEYVNARHMSPLGPIVSHWRRRGQTFEWDVTVPVGATATAYVPVDANARVTEGGQPASEAPGVAWLRSEPGREVFELSSGVYSLRSE